jgi:predicted dehydrogenase
LRVGVIGLGRLWEARHKPALLRLRERFHVTAVYDQVLRRAELEAAQLGCAAVEGLTSLVERPDVDVVYLLSAQWFGIYPAEIACRFRKPVYCAMALTGFPEELRSLSTLIEQSGIPFMPELPRRFYPATLRLRELLATTLGRPRLILGQTRQFGFDRYGQPGPSTQIAPAPLLIDPGSNLLDWCRFIFQAAPLALMGCGAVVLPGLEGESAERDFESFSVEFDGGGMAHMAFGRYHRQPWGEATRFLPQPGIQVFAEHGAAWLELPERIQWTDGKAVHDERLPLEPSVGETLNDQFYRLIRGEHSLAPTIQDALALADWVEDLKRSQGSGSKVVPQTRR